MKIAILAHDRFPIAAPFAGGMESFVWNLTRRLRRLGHEVVLFAAPGSDPGLGAEELCIEPFELSNEARADVAMPPEAQVRSTVSYMRAMIALAQRHDVQIIHNNSLHYVPVSFSDLVAQPVLTTLHTPPHPWIEPALRQRPRGRTVAVSESVASKWAAITQAEVVPNGVDLDDWRLGPGGDALVWSGRIVPEKAPHVAVEIARRSGRVLRLAGPVGDSRYFAEKLEPLLDDRAVYVGHLDPPELHTLVGSSAACIVAPAWDEPYGLVAAEALASGTPVLAVARGGLPEFVRPPAGVAVAVDASANAVDRALERVIGFDRAEVRRHAEETCSLDVMVSRYSEIYEELLL